MCNVSFDTVITIGTDSAVGREFRSGYCCELSVESAGHVHGHESAMHGVEAKKKQEKDRVRRLSIGWYSAVCGSAIGSLRGLVSTTSVSKLGRTLQVMCRVCVLACSSHFGGTTRTDESKNGASLLNTACIWNSASRWRYCIVSVSC